MYKLQCKKKSFIYRVKGKIDAFIRRAIWKNTLEKDKLMRYMVNVEMLINPKYKETYQYHLYKIQIRIYEMKIGYYKTLLGEK